MGPASPTAFPPLWPLTFDQLTAGPHEDIPGIFCFDFSVPRKSSNFENSYLFIRNSVWPHSSSSIFQKFYSTNRHFILCVYFVSSSGFMCCLFVACRVQDRRGVRSGNRGSGFRRGSRQAFLTTFCIHVFELIILFAKLHIFRTHRLAAIANRRTFLIVALLLYRDWKISFSL